MERRHKAIVACRLGMFEYMSSHQLAIRFSRRQIETLDALAQEAHTTRSAIIKKLVDDAEKVLIAAAYAAGYPLDGADIDAFGDLGAFHREAEADASPVERPKHPGSKQSGLGRTVDRQRGRINRRARRTTASSSMAPFASRTAPAVDEARRFSTSCAHAMSASVGEKTSFVMSQCDG